MPEVLVDLEDLENLVFGAGAIKGIEAALDQTRRDPFAKPHLDFTAAHNRLATVVRRARRNPADTLVNYDEPLADVERKMLQELSKGPEVAALPVKAKLPQPGEAMSVLDRLAVKGCVMIGHFVSGVVWSGDPKPTISADPGAYAVKLTDRGFAKLRE